jgi:hypothetical protein
MINFIIHPGFVKTGSTFFQKNVIPKLDNFISIGKPYNDSNLHDKIKLLFYSKKTHSFKKKLVKNLALEIFSNIENKKLKNIIFSDEAFLDSEFYNPQKNIIYLELLVKQLRKKTKVNLSFILTTRNQTNLIISRFAYVHPNLRKKYSSLENYIDKNIKKNSFFFQSIKFYKFKNSIQKKFKCKIYLIPLESLENNRTKYLGILKKIFLSNIKINKIKFSKTNINSKNYNFYIRKGNKWYETYLLLRKMKFLVPTRYTEDLKKLLSKKIKFNQSDLTLKHDNMTLNKIRKYFLFDNKKLLKKNKINYL